MTDQEQYPWRYSIGRSPDIKRTYEEYLQAVKLYNPDIEYVPNKFKTKELCLAAFEQENYGLLREIPINKRTKEICEKSLDQSGANFRFIPIKYWTKDLLYKAALNHPWIFTEVSIPDDLWTEKLAKDIVLCAGWALEFVPKKLKTYDLCKSAISTFGMALRYTPKDLRNYELSLLAVTNTYSAIQYVDPDYWKDEDIFFACMTSFVGIQFKTFKPLWMSFCASQGRNCVFLKKWIDDEE